MFSLAGDVLPAEGAAIDCLKQAGQGAINGCQKLTWREVG